MGEALLQRLDDPDAYVQMQLAYSLGEWHDPRAGKALGQLAVRHAKDNYLLAAVLSSAVPHVTPMLAEVRAEHGPADLIQKLTKLADDLKRHPVQVATVETTLRGAIPTPGEGLIQGQTTAERQAALDKFAPVLNMKGDPVSGKKVFVEATCSLCHRLEDVGTEIGPDIKTLIDRSPENLLIAIIDPNRAVKERFVEYFVRTADGRVYSGALLEQTGNSITLADNKGQKIVLLRRDLEEIVPTTRSHMGEGLESSLTLQKMADLLSFLAQAGPPRKRFTGNQPNMVLSTQDGLLPLPAEQAEIYGPDIIYDPALGCISSWTNAGAYVVWSFHLQWRQTCDIWAETACPATAAGKPFLVELVSQTLPGKMPATDSWKDFRWHKVGRVTLDPGAHRIALRADGALSGPWVNLRALKLTPPGRAPVAGSPDQPQEAKPTLVKPAADGSLPLRAVVGHGVGPQIKFEAPFQNFGFFSGADRAEWEVQLAKEGLYEVSLTWAVDDQQAGKSFVITLGEQRVEGVAERTGSWENYKQAKIGRVKLAAGKLKVSIRPKERFNGYLMDLREIRLVPVTEGK